MLRWEAPALSIALFAFASGAAAQGAQDALIAKHAAANSVPETLVRRVIRIESRGNPKLVVRGNYGLMQIRLGTARAMGYTGGPEGLLDPDTNMTYAVKYLAGAYRTAGCNPDRAVANYQHGYRRKARLKCHAPVEQTQVAAKEDVSKAAGKPGAKGERGMILAQSQARPASPPDNEPAQEPDVLKPKIVHTVPIPKLVSPPPQPIAPARPAPNVATPTLQTQPASVPEPKPVVAKPAFVPTTANASAKSDKVVTAPPRTPVASVPDPELAPAKPAATAKPEKIVTTAPKAKQASTAKSEPAPANPNAGAKADKVVTPPAQTVEEPATTGLLATMESGQAAATVNKAPIVQPHPRPERHAALSVASKHVSKRQKAPKKAEKTTDLIGFLKKLITPDKKAHAHRKARQSTPR